MSAPKSLIVNSPYEPPLFHWQEEQGKLVLQEGRRPAGYEIIDTRTGSRRLASLDLVNRIRDRVEAWRKEEWPGLTTVSRRLLEHWHDRTGRLYPFYFCQLEAIETLMWWVEAPPTFKQGIAIPGDGGPWERLCSKMATGTGKTIVMGMIVTWQAINALTYPHRKKDFSSAIFVVAPGLTVKERLQVLYPSHPSNVYDEFSLCPSEALRHKLNQAEILIENWHALMPLKEPERSVVKKGPESDKAFVRRVLGKLAEHRDIVVINDEAHHAYRIPAGVRVKKREEDGIDPEEATRWIEGLDRIHREIRIGRCFDLSATPFAPTGRTNTEEGLFEWIVSDFGLNDAIEAGLVKTPRVVVRDGVIPDTQTLRPKLYHLYRDPSVSEDLNRKGARPHEPLPELVQQAYVLLGADWVETARRWKEAGHDVPPVMLTVCNRTQTAARIENFFLKDLLWEDLRSPGRTLRVDSRVLEKAERGESATADRDYERRLREIVESSCLSPERKEELLSRKKEELLRELVDTVGKRGRAGQDLQAIVSVAMLSEGWDARNVTHIMGLRAFTSQLLCEQVIGRGLRRVGYDTERVVGPDGVERELFRPEYVNVFGVPLSVFQEVGDEGEAPIPSRPVHQIESLPERAEFEIRWPNIVRVETVVRPKLTVDWSRVGLLRLDPSVIPIEADLAPALGGAADLSKVERIELEKLPESFRLQRQIFRAAAKAFDELGDRFNGRREFLAFQLVRLVEAFLDSHLLEIPSRYHRFHEDGLLRRILITLSVDRIVQHLLGAIEEQNVEELEPIFDDDFPIGSTGQMRTWYTTRECAPTLRSQISHVVVDSAWEKYAAELLETHPGVAAWAKNDHLGFHVLYSWRGSKRRYVPDFLVRLTNGGFLVLEIKGRTGEEAQAKRAAMRQWAKAVNGHGGFGTWLHEVAYEMGGLRDVLDRHSEASRASESGA